MTTPAFCAAVKDARTRAGLSSYALSMAVAPLVTAVVQPGHAGAWESGKRDPSPETIVAIAEVLGLDPAELCRLAGKIHPAIRAALNNPVYVQAAYALAASHDAL